MEVLFFKDSRKTNTIESFAKDNEGRVLLDEKGRKVVEKIQVEFKTILLEIPVHENTINFDQYARGSKFRLTPIHEATEDTITISKSEYEALTSGKNYLVPHSFVVGLDTLMDSLRTVIAIVQDLSDSAKKGANE